MYECLAYYIDLNGIETERLKHYFHIKFKKKNIRHKTIKPDVGENSEGLCL